MKLEPAGRFAHHGRAPRGGAPCLVFATQDLLPGEGDGALAQLAGVARLPGLLPPAIAMPDLHEGYDFPIGTVAAFDLARGVISPGGVGYDINCGVRLYATDRAADEFRARVKPALAALARAVPSGVGTGSRFRLPRKDLLDVLALGAKWCVKKGMADAADLARIEEGGASLAADPDLLSPRALERGEAQLATLGSGNHFLELGHVEKVFDAEAARAFGLSEGMATLLLHTGSRGLGHQVCTDFLEAMKRGGAGSGGAPGCAPIDSPLGRDYYRAMMAAANYAWANRQRIGYHLIEALAALFGKAGFRARLVQDVSHNLARREEVLHLGKRVEAMVHRKGAVRALPAGDPALPPDLLAIGQPVILPGDMGSASYVLVAAPDAGRVSFSSVCHGAGRRLSRKRALAELDPRAVLDGLARSGVTLHAGGKDAIREEAPAAYKDIDRVVATVTGAGLARVVARLRPIGVLKG